MRAILSAFAVVLVACACGAPEPAPLEPMPQVREPAESAGYLFAQAHCAGCHAIRPGERLSPVPGATPFVLLSETSGMTGYALAAWLRTSHPTMPDLIVEDARIAEVWDYMRSLKRAPDATR